MLECIYTSRKNFAWETPDRSWFIPWWGAALVEDALLLSKQYYKVFPDATTIHLADWPIPHNSLGPLDAGNLYAWVKNPEAGSNWWALPVDKFTLQADRYATPILPYALDPSISYRCSLPYIDRVAGVYVVARYPQSATSGIYIYKNLDQSLIRWIALPTWGIDVSHGVKLRYAGPSRLAVLLSNSSRTSGRCALIDWQAGEILLDSTLDSYFHAEFDQVHQIFWTIGRDNKSRVYSLNIKPYALSNPVFDPTGDVYALQPRKVKVRLTGNNGEPCPDWVIHWALDMGRGALRWDRSKTGADGYAYNYFWPGETLGLEIITAWMQM